MLLRIQIIRWARVQTITTTVDNDTRKRQTWEIPGTSDQLSKTFKNFIHLYTLQIFIAYLVNCLVFPFSPAVYLQNDARFDWSE